MDLVESIISSTLEKVGELLFQEAVFGKGVREQVEAIQRELKRVQGFLRDADRRPRESDEQMKTFVVDVTEVANDAEDAIEMFILSAERKRRRGAIEKYIYIFNDFFTLREIGLKIEKIKKRIGEISRSGLAYGVPKIHGGEGPSYLSRKLQEYRQNAAVAEGEEIVGFVEDADALVQLLTTGDIRRRVVSIVAPGGAGKTTLANRVYKNNNVRNHFSAAVAWVCVSQNYSAKELLQEIAQQVMGMSRQDLAVLNIRVLQTRLSEFLEGRRYLIVLDDMWNNDAWDQLKAAFPDGMNGSRIMLTTRIKGVALHANPDLANPPYELPFLTSEESWKLFLKKAFPWKMSDITCPAELVDVGKQIVVKCNGLPLAISVTGGILAAKGDGEVKDWMNILSSLKGLLSQELVHCSDILALSYHDLPHFLKPCFLYLGLFPEDTEIFVKRLTRLWVAEGFIQPREGQTKEDIAEDYLMELVGRSMLQVVEREWDGSVVT